MQRNALIIIIALPTTFLLALPLINEELVMHDHRKKIPIHFHSVFYTHSRYFSYFIWILREQLNRWESMRMRCVRKGETHTLHSTCTHNINNSGLTRPYRIWEMLRIIDLYVTGKNGSWKNKKFWAFTIFEMLEKFLAFTCNEAIFSYIFQKQMGSLIHMCPTHYQAPLVCDKKL